MATPPSLYPRSLAFALEQAMSDTPVVCLAGARQTGKTTLVQASMREHAYTTLDDPQVLNLARTDPRGFLATLPPYLMIDEIQRAPELLPAIKMSVDMDRRPGRYVLTGSANLFMLPTLTESLAGRMETIHLMPLTESEKERQPGRFLKNLLDGAIGLATDPQRAEETPRDLGNRLVAGGYPEAVSRTPARARQWHRQYVQGIVERDVFDVAKIRKAHAVATLLRLLALRNGELVNASRLSRDLNLDRDTVGEYIAVLERLFLVRRLQPWHRNVGKRLVKAPKLHLVDSGLAATLADLEANDWHHQRTRMGHLLESFVVQQIVAQAGWTDPDVRCWHFRDRDKREVDLVVTRGSDVWGIEVKATSAPGLTAGPGMARLASLSRNDFRGGVVLYNGVHVLPMAPLGDKPVRAVPLRELWAR